MPQPEVFHMNSKNANEVFVFMEKLRTQYMEGAITITEYMNRCIVALTMEWDGKEE